MEQAIKKSIEGGYVVEISPADYLPTVYVKDGYFIEPAEIREDPTFWQCLGKAMKLDGSTYGWEKENEDKWVTLWHRFIDHLIEGKDADSFFTNLIK